MHPAAKEVLRYREALDVGWRLVSERHPGPFSRTGIPGVGYTPPQDATEIVALMGALETELNAPGRADLDPIVRSKPRYYELLQSVRDRGTWEEWVLYVLDAVEASARESIASVRAIGAALFEVKHRVRNEFKAFYSQDLINNLFANPYTKVQFVQHDLGVSRITATKYLDLLAGAGILQKVKVGRASYYINVRLLQILTGDNPA